MDETPVKEIGFDESFKILAKDFFGAFSKVITDFEIIKLPKKADVLVIEAEKPITEYVSIFNYFKKFNIIEFKSVNDPFRIGKDIPKILVYIGGILLNEKKASIENTTFTLICSGKPEKFLWVYKDDIQKIKNGVYLIEKLLQVPVYIVLTNEVGSPVSVKSSGKVWELDKEVALLKEFSTGNEKILFIEKLLHEVQKGNQKLIHYLHFAFSFYRNEMRNIIKKEGMSMTIVEKNIREWADELGLKDKFINEGKKEEKVIVAGKMLKKGFSIEDIIETTELSTEEILKLKKNIVK